MSDNEEDIDNNEEEIEDEQNEGIIENQAKVDVGEEEAKEEEEKNEEEEEEEERPPDVVLTEDMVPEMLLLLCKTGNGLAHAYVRLEGSGKELTDISLLKNYIHLRYIDLSNNNLKDVSALNVLTHMLTLKLDFNKLTNIKLDILPYLQVASFSDNKIKSIEVNCLPKLEQLNLNNNEITSLNQLRAERFPSLEALELRGNKLQTTKGMNLPKLKSLYMAANLLSKIEDFDTLPLLTTLHLRDNKIEHLDGFTDSLKALQYINLRGNNISEYAQVKKLNVLPKLRALVLLDTPLIENDDYRLECLIAVRRLERLDKDQFTEDERSEAEEIFEQRRVKELEEATAANAAVVDTTEYPDLENAEAQD